MTRYFRIKPLAPLIARDSRPFGAGQGNRIRSLDWLSQSVLAGAVRSTVWKENDKLTPEQLKQISVAGGFPLLDGNIYFPRPLDLLLHRERGEDTEKVFPIRPMEEMEGMGVRMPVDMLPSMPLGLPEDDFKPERIDAFWSAATMCDWLIKKDPDANKFQLCDTLPFPLKEERTHVTINESSGAAEDTKLFSTVGLDFTVKPKRTAVQKQKLFYQMEVSVSADFGGFDILPNDFIVPLGGERRLARFGNSEDEQLWRAPKDLGEAIKGCRRVRMVLASHAIFSSGWLPGWLDDNLSGVIPGTDTRVRLVSAIVDRWKPISGWSYEKGKNVPKALRRMVPAGSVYFFDVVSGSFELDKVWLRSVCDDVQDRLDGFGLALWGCC